MPVEMQLNDQVLQAKIIGEIDHHTAKDIREAIDEKLMNALPKELRLDFTRVSFMDSSGIGLVMGRYKTAHEIGCRVSVSGANPRTVKVFRLSGLSKFVEIQGGSRNEITQ